MGPRGAGRRLNDQERMEILEIIQREAKVKNVDLAKRYGVSEGAIRKLKQMKDTIRNRYFMGNEHNRDKRKRGGFKRNAPFEQELFDWIVRMRETQSYQLMPLTQTAVRQQAILLAKKYDRMSNFKASPGWFARFCSRHQLDPISAPDATGGQMPPSSVEAGLADASVPQSVTVPPAVSLPMAAADTANTAADETAFLMDTLTAAPAEAVEEEIKTDASSINEQAQIAAREHNEAALRAAAAKIGEAAEEKETETKSELPVVGDTKQEVAVAEDEIFSLGL